MNDGSTKYKNPIIELKEVLLKHNLSIGYSDGFIIVSKIDTGEDLVKASDFLIGDDL